MYRIRNKIEFYRDNLSLELKPRKPIFLMHKDFIPFIHIKRQNLLL